MTFQEAWGWAFVLIGGRKFWELMVTITQEQMNLITAAIKIGLPSDKIPLNRTPQQLRLIRELNQLAIEAARLAGEAVGCDGVAVVCDGAAVGCDDPTPEADPAISFNGNAEALETASPPRGAKATSDSGQGSWRVQLTAARKMLGTLQPSLEAALETLDDMAAGPAPPDPGSAPGDEWVTAKESGLGVRHFRRAAKRGDIPAHRVGRQLVARRSDVDRYIEQQPVATKLESIPKSDPFDNALANGKLTPLQKENG